MGNTETVTPPAFCGWHRRNGGPWQKMTEGRTAGDTLRVLLDIIHELPGKGGDSIVLPAGQHPGKGNPR
jgi:hypothetical protein